MTKLLLIGVGRWGTNHLRVLSSLPVELYVVDHDAGRLAAAHGFGIEPERVAHDHRKFLRDMDGVIIVTPAPSHYPLVREALELGKDVFVEKPITLVSSEAAELTLLAEKHKRILQVGHIFRFDSATRWLRGAVSAGAFGKLHMLRGHFGGFKRPRHDSGVTFADAIHFIDLFNFLLDGRPISVSASFHDFMGRGMEDTSHVSMEYETADGVCWATVDADYFLPGKFRQVTVVGTDLSAVCDYNLAQYKIKTFANRHVEENGKWTTVDGVTHQVECAPEEPLLSELRAFVDSIHSRISPIADGWSGVHAVEVIEAAAESARTGRRISLPAVSGRGERTLPASRIIAV